MSQACCPHCQQSVDLPASFIGKTVKCAQCQQRFVFPAADNRTTTSNPAPGNSSSPSALPTSHSETDIADIIRGEVSQGAGKELGGGAPQSTIPFPPTGIAPGTPTSAPGTSTGSQASTDRDGDRMLLMLVWLSLGELIVGLCGALALLAVPWLSEYPSATRFLAVIVAVAVATQAALLLLLARILAELLRLIREVRSRL